MSNKAIDKVYLQRQLKNFNRDVSAQLYIAYMSALPTPAIDVESTPTYYNADQYKQYGGKIIQWTGATTTWGSGATEVTLTEGLFYKLNMTDASQAGEDPYYTLSSISPIISGGGSTDTITYSIAPLQTPSTGALKTYQLYQSVNSGANTPVEGSIIDIPKDFLVKNASVVTATTNGGFWFKGLWYEYDNTWDYSQQSGLPALPTGYTTIYKYDNVSGDSLYSEVDVSDLDSYDQTQDFWPHELFSLTETAWVSEGAVLKADFTEGWMTTEGLTVGKKYIDFVINVKEDVTGGTTDDEHLYLALDDLISTYTAGAGISIGSDNTISLNFQYTTLPNPTVQGFDSSAYPSAIQYVGTDEAWGTVDGTENGTEIASPKQLQLGGFYKYDSTSTKWVLINTAKEDVDIDFASSLSDFR